MSIPITLPNRLQIPFAYAGTKNIIPVNSASPLASYTDGFPTVNMTPIANGGVPPRGEDFNGIFNIISAHVCWQNAGGQYPFNSSLATAMGGYSIGMVVQMNDGLSAVVSTVNNNMTDPNSSMTGWAIWAGAGVSGVLDLSNLNIYEDNAAALAANEIAGTPYRNSVGDLKVVFDSAINAFLSPTGTSSMTVLGTMVFTSDVTGSADKTGVWKVNGITNGNSSVGTITGAGTARTYTAPATGAVYAVSFTANADPTKTATSYVSVSDATGLSIAGFGYATTGGAGQTVVHVTNLNDSGAGSFRTAVSTSNRYVVFDVSGTINLTTTVYFGSNITLDGSTAPGSGITITGPSLMLSAISNVIITNIRMRAGYSGTSEEDCISIMNGSHNVVLDHVSMSNHYDEALGIWNGCYDITIQNCIMGDGNAAGERYGSLCSNSNLRVTYYHNLFHEAYYRSPAIGWDTTGGTVAPSIVADVVNNLIWNYPTRGTTVYWGGKANVVGNYYYSENHPAEPYRAVNIETLGEGYSSGNYSKDGSSTTGNVASPFTVLAQAQISASSAATAATFVKANAGCRVGGLDAFDTAVMADVVL